MNALEIAIKGLVDEKLSMHENVSSYNSTDLAYNVNYMYRPRLKEIDIEIERLLTLEYYPQDKGESRDRLE